MEEKNTKTKGFVAKAATETATKALAAQLAAVAEPGDVILLSGELGAGKTAFARGFIQALTHEGQEVPSPSFTLAQSYDGKKGPIWHFDFYRLADESEIAELGWDEALGQAIILAEWPDRLGKRIPAERLDITAAFLDGDEDERAFTFAGYGRWQKKLEQINKGMIDA